MALQLINQLMTRVDPRQMPEIEAWSAAYNAVSDDLDLYRRRLAAECAPWFDGSAFTGSVDGLPVGIEKVFWQHVAKGDGCWLWRLAERNGYGAIKYQQRSYYAHRISYLIAYGAIPKDAVVRHRCDTPLCVRPEHLVVGSHLDNMKDMRDRGRSRKDPAWRERVRNAWTPEKRAVVSRRFSGIAKSQEQRAKIALSTKIAKANR